MFPLLPFIASAATAIASSLRAIAASTIRKAIKKAVSSAIDTIVKSSSRSIVSDALGPDATKLLKEAKKALNATKIDTKKSPDAPKKTSIPKETLPEKSHSPAPKTSDTTVKSQNDNGDGSNDDKQYVWQDALGSEQPDIIGTKDSIYFRLSQEEKQKLWDAYKNGDVAPYDIDELREFGAINFI